MTLIFFSFTGMAQRIALSGSASIDPPKKFRKAQQSERSSLVTKRFGKTKFLAKSIQDPEKVYIVDDVILYINSTDVTAKTDALKELKVAFDDTFQGVKDYSSKIEKIGAKDVFVIDQVSEGLKLYRFTTINSYKNVVVNGFIQYNPGDEAKARTILEDLIKGLKFE